MPQVEGPRCEKHQLSEEDADSESQPDESSTKKLRIGSNDEDDVMGSDKVEDADDGSSGLSDVDQAREESEEGASVETPPPPETKVDLGRDEVGVRKSSPQDRWPFNNLGLRRDRSAYEVLLTGTRRASRPHQSQMLHQISLLHAERCPRRSVEIGARRRKQSFAQRGSS